MCAQVCQCQNGATCVRCSVRMVLPVSGVSVSEQCYLCQVCVRIVLHVSDVSVSEWCYLCQSCQCQSCAICVRCVSVRATLPVSGVSVSKRCYLRKMVVLQRVMRGITVWAVHRCVGVSTVLPVIQRLDSATVRQG